MVYLDKKYVILEDRIDFADILQSMRNEKSVKDLTFWVALDSLREVWQVFDTFSTSRQNKIEKFKFSNYEWHVRR